MDKINNYTRAVYVRTYEILRACGSDDTLAGSAMRGVLACLERVAMRAVSASLGAV